MKYSIPCLLLILIGFGCQEQRKFEIVKEVVKIENGDKNQFSRILHDISGVHFKNTIEETKDLNLTNFAYIYNGAGVAAADFNNDGLVDLYFTSNQESNSMYLNKGEFVFEDITDSAKVMDSIGWSTGVSVVDINRDGWLDLYICKSGAKANKELRENRLFVNQKDNTFKEESKKWNLNDAGFGTQSYFFDFDQDGDLDMYLVNHRPDFENTTRISKKIQSQVSSYSSDKLYRNDGKVFTDITQQAGLINKAWGLSASIGDFNQDNLPDIYVCNDFLEPDMLYINNGDGTFTDEILDIMGHISFNSMGSDLADMNNDLLPDLLVMEMAAEDHIRSKTNMASMNTKSFIHMVEMGYHYQYMVNTLQLNRGKGKFSDIAQMSGLAKTDWSWAPLIVDLDNDGLKDVFVTNGILKDLANQDSKRKWQDKLELDPTTSFMEFQNILPSNKIGNYSFINNGDLTFSNSSDNWGFNAGTQSNGVAYADFDNDGDLDLVVNNINDFAHIYRNNDSDNFIQIKLEGDTKNPMALGTKVTIEVADKKQFQQLYLSRGYLSSMQNIVNFGLGKDTKIDHLKIEWPDNSVTTLNDLEANQIVSLRHKDAKKTIQPSLSNKTFFNKIESESMGIGFQHRENDFDDFKNQILLPHSQSTNGPFIDKTDVNGDGLEDFYVGGATGQAGELYIQGSDGKFSLQKSLTWRIDAKYEDLGVLFFDADNDNDQDLYVVSGGSEYKENSDLYQDRLYLNDGKGNFKKNKQALPIITSSGQCVKASDIDNDGDLDLFVGGRVVPDKYPFAPRSHVLRNTNGKFEDVTDLISPDLINIGMVTDATFMDYDMDGDNDLLVVGEWMPIRLFENVHGELRPKEIESLKNTTGIWFSIDGNDIDNDGDIDFFVGNLGLNAKFKVNSKKEFHIFCDDFDSSGTWDIVLSNTYKGNLVPSRGRECSSQQMPFIKSKFPDFQSFAEASLADVYGMSSLEKAVHYEANLLASVFLENKGNGEFVLKKLPNMVQLSPIMDFEFIDMDSDGINEIVLIGNHYNTEVETARYDASFGSVLSYKHHEFDEISTDRSGFLNDGNAKNMVSIKTNSGSLLIVANNDQKLGVFNFGKN